MSLTFEEISEAAMHLPADSRAELAQKLAASLHDAAEIEAQWIEVAERRLDELLSGRVEGIPVEQAMAEIRAMVGR